jgi:hypothetical protein
MTARRRNLVLTVVTLAVVVFSTAAFVRTQALKQEEAPIAGIRFDGRVSPGCDCPREQAELSFTLDRAQPIGATIVDEDGDPVRTLLDGALRASGRETLRWDGADQAGEAVPDGDYRLRVDLAVPDRSITIPADVRVEGGSDSARRLGPRA